MPMLVETAQSCPGLTMTCLMIKALGDGVAEEEIKAPRRRGDVSKPEKENGRALTDLGCEIHALACTRTDDSCQPRLAAHAATLEFSAEDPRRRKEEEFGRGSLPDALKSPSLSALHQQKRRHPDPCHDRLSLALHGVLSGQLRSVR